MALPGLGVNGPAEATIPGTTPGDMTRSYLLDTALGTPPDLILLDIMVPKINGHKVCRLICAPGLEMPIIK